MADRRLIAFLVALVAVVAYGCNNQGPTSPQTVDLVGLDASFSGELRPQPEPPGSIFRFVVLLEEDDGDWFGTFGDGESSCGFAELTDPTLSESGEVTHVSFDLRLVTHDGNWQVSADLSGIMNQVNGLLVLNGETTSGSLFRAQVHQNGSIVDPGGDNPLSFLGELMLRPQPEPPGRVAGAPTYPPNPC